ncbi:MAG: site-specific DNA-methyltransferase [Butyrivibrio sp.]|uniref:site-specific DNA-methyltransferase n=1 Tax=Butyrivibrio sp. TaxID=28121 RepID=UPI0025FF7FDD|nr:site-specific DNA-methyltransferase [Butyrivibrio sp.]MCR5771417.1 site-specific DNA-methyltransferase [Butyrivibrio sp.]
MEKQGKLELTWVNKYKEENLEPRILIEDKDKSYGEKNAENMLIHGDNLLALRALEDEFRGKIKCVYIDPPYNTGSAFEEYDDNLEQSQWLSLIKPRLEIIWRLLSEDGSLWISIDDDEQAYMKVLCDELFGRNHFVASIVWQKRTSPDMRAAISDGHEYILVYAKDYDEFKKKRNKLSLSPEQAKNYKNPDNDPRGPWTSTDCTAQAGHGTKDQFYTFVTPAGREITLPPNLCWRFTKERLEEEIAAGRIWLGKDGKGVPRKKTYLSENTGIVPWTWWTNKDVGHTQEAKKEVNELFGDNSFATPKPERLIERIINIATNPGDLIMDSFLGSGTTIAVAQKLGRKWIGIELGEHCYTHCKVRIDKVIDGEQGGISKNVNWNGGGGYRFYELAEPLLIRNKYLPVYQINPKYTWEMVCEAICKIEGYKYFPDGDFQGHSSENRFIHITEEYVNSKYIVSLMKNVGENQSVLIYCKKNQADMMLPENVEVKKIPKDLLDKCSFDYESEVQD